MENKETNTHRTFETGSVRDDRTGKGRYDLLPWDAIDAIAKHFERGALKYGEDNWRKGQPLSAYMDSGPRHLQQFITGKTDEDHPDPERHLVAAVWNFLAALETLQMIRNGELPESLKDLRWMKQQQQAETETRATGPCHFHYAEREKAAKILEAVANGKIKLTTEERHG